MLLLESVFLADFFFNLLQGFQEELLDFTSLVQNDLGKSTHISQLFVLNAKVFTSINDLLTLLLDNGLVLVPDHFFLFLEVTHDLSQRFLQNLNLVLVRLDLVCLIASALLVLLLSPSIDSDVTFDFAVCFLLLLDFFLVFLELVALRDSL